MTVTSASKHDSTVMKISDYINKTNPNVTSASKHDSTVMEALLHGEEEVVYGDKAYASAGRQAEARGVVWRVSRKGGRGRKDRVFPARIISS